MEPIEQSVSRCFTMFSTIREQQEALVDLLRAHRVEAAAMATGATWEAAADSVLVRCANLSSCWFICHDNIRAGLRDRARAAAQGGA